MILPLARISPVQIPRRDLVLGRADSLALFVTVVDRDDPQAVPIEVTGGIGGPTLQMIVWPDCRYRNTWDYGAPTHGPRTVLWSAVATGSDGSFTIAFPTATMAGWPRRCAYALQIDWNAGYDTELLAEGMLHLHRSAARASPPLIMLTDTDPAVLTDPETEVILLAGAPPI